MPACASALNGVRLLLRRQRTQACAVSQAGNGRRRGRRHKEPKPTRRRGSCVAAPEKGKQLIRVGQRGASGGMQGGPRRGRSPITGPALPPAAQAAQTKIKKSPRARRAQQTPLKGQARFLCQCPKFSPLVTTSLSLTTSRHSKDFPQPMQRPQNAHSTRIRTLALRGAKGDHRAQRGSSRSRSRAALAECRKLESP